MRTVTFKSVLDWVASKALGHPLLMGQEEAETYTRYINDAVRECWEREPWPEWTLFEERAYQQPYAAGELYEEGTMVSYGVDGETRYYTTTQSIDAQALALYGEIAPVDGTSLFQLATGGNLILEEDDDTSLQLTAAYGNQFLQLAQGGNLELMAGGTLSLTEATLISQAGAEFWELSTSTTRLIPLDQKGRFAIGTLLGVGRTDARMNPRNGMRLDALFSPDGITIFDAAAANTVWLHYRRRPPEFTAEVWTSGSYAAGDRVYYPTTGECYLCLEEASTEPPTDPEVWEKIDMPYVLAPAVQRFAYAEALEDDGQHEKAIRTREDAEERLGMEWQKSEGQQGITRRFDVLSRESSHSYTYAIR